MTYSAFGVDHYGQAIAKKDAKLLTRARPLVSGGLRQVQGAAQRVISNPNNANMKLSEAKTPLVNELSQGSPAHGAIETIRGLRGKVKAAQAAGSTDSAARIAASSATVGDVHRAANVRRITEAPENLLRGKKKTTSETNLLTGDNSRHVSREGNRFLKPLDVTHKGGEKTYAADKKGGLTGTGKTVVGGGVAATGLGGAAYQQKRNATAGY